MIGAVGALPFRWRRRAGDWAAAAPVKAVWLFLTTPAVAWALHALAIWLWHAPSLYQATLGSELAHTAQHLSFLGTGLLFWWALLQGREGRIGRPASVIYLFTTAVHTSLLGVPARLLRPALVSPVRCHLRPLGTEPTGRSTARGLHHVGAGRSGLFSGCARPGGNLAQGPGTPPVRSAGAAVGRKGGQAEKRKEKAEERRSFRPFRLHIFRLVTYRLAIASTPPE